MERSVEQLSEYNRDCFSGLETMNRVVKFLLVQGPETAELDDS